MRRIPKILSKPQGSFLISFELVEAILAETILHKVSGGLPGVKRGALQMRPVQEYVPLVCMSALIESGIALNFLRTKTIPKERVALIQQTNSSWKKTEGESK
jgi:hypothetical protein